MAAATFDLGRLPLVLDTTMLSLILDFYAETTQGSIQFHEFKKGVWAVFFSFITDFSPICTTEVGMLSKMTKDWEARGVKVIGLACNSLQTHMQWLQDVEELQKCGGSVTFPMIADGSRSIATRYGMVDVNNVANIDQKVRIHWVTKYRASSLRRDLPL